MTRSALRKLVLLCAICVTFAPAAGQDWEPEERLIVPIPDGWAPVGTDTTEAGRLTVYRSAIEPDNDQIGVQRFLGVGGQAPADVAARMLDSLPNSCRPDSHDLTTPPDRNGRALAIASVICAPQPSAGGSDDVADVIEVSRVLVLQGDQDLHLLTRIWRGAPGGPRDPTGGDGAASAWTFFFDAVTYCPADGC